MEKIKRRDMKQYQKEYQAKNREKLNVKKRIYRLKNKKRIKEYFAIYQKKISTKPVKFKTYAHQLIDYECREGDDAKLEVRCKNCNTWFMPNHNSVNSRTSAIKGQSASVGAEHHLYCSDICKKSCDLFHAHVTPKHLRVAAKQSRCNQPVNKKSLLAIQTDQYGYNFCDKCGTKTDKLAIHHSIMVSENYKEADNMAHQLLLCGACHKKPEAHCR